MFDRLKDLAARFESGTPGRRFLRVHEEYRGRVNRGTRILLLVVAFFLILAGIVLGPAPVLPGVVPLAAGLALLSTQSRIVAVALDRVEVRLVQPLLRRFRGRSRASRGGQRAVQKTPPA